MILVWHLWLQRNIFIVFVCSSFSFYILIYGRTQSFMFLQEENTRDFDAWIATLNFEDVNCCTCHPQAVKYPETFAVYRNSLNQTVLIFKLQLLSWVSHADISRFKVCNFYIYNIRLFRNNFLSNLFSYCIFQLAPFSPNDVIWKQYLLNWWRGKVSKLPTCEKHISRENFWFHTCPRWDFWSQLFFSKFCWLVFDLWATSTAILRRSASFLFLCGLIFVVIALCKNIITMVWLDWPGHDQSHLESFLPNSLPRKIIASSENILSSLPTVFSLWLVPVAHPLESLGEDELSHSWLCHASRCCSAGVLAPSAAAGGNPGHGDIVECAPSPEPDCTFHMQWYCCW